jgi:predicted  nucleic acid-binding Zn-ribbon protein
VVETEHELKSDKVGHFIKEIERLEAQVATLGSSLQKKDSHISVLENQLSVLKEQQKDGAKLGKLEKALESSNLKVKQLEDQVSGAVANYEQARKDVEVEKKRADAAEESVRQLTAKYEKSQEAYLGSKKHAAVLEKNLKNAEVDISEAEKRLKAHGEELARVHKSWLPPWAASHVAVLRTRASTKWTSHAKPHVDALYTTASLKAAEAHSFLRPHYDNFVSKAGPEARKQWKKISDSVSPHVKLLRIKTAKGYKEYVGKAHKFLHPHYQTVLKSTKPYVNLVQEKTRPHVDRVYTFSKPHVENARKFVNVNIEKASPYYRDAVSAALKQHEDLQGYLKENIAKNEFGKHLITNEAVWFIASALLALPVLAAFVVFSSMFSAKKKPTHKSKRASPTGSTGSSGVTVTKTKRAKKADK